MKNVKLEIVKEFGSVLVVKFYANEWEGTYGDVFNSKAEAKAAHPHSKIIQGYGIINSVSGYCHEDSRDWYDSKEEAMDEALALS